MALSADQKVTLFLQVQKYLQGLGYHHLWVMETRQNQWDKVYHIITSSGRWVAELDAVSGSWHHPDDLLTLHSTDQLQKLTYSAQGLKTTITDLSAWIMHQQTRVAVYEKSIISTAIDKANADLPEGKKKKRL
ncbi:hypothetical protein BBB57_03775 [Kosakonia sacchari]|uniref:hypothetical protein n=1 Tax=Kosakonia sacchari TaxID=1158459 RepID=UPI0008074EB8|nr:hypothetical protein [Kosakonia sacchari]ANR77453.1 hypothetical protein BBB57_03775 [Kosakonia sacchari]MDN2488012.1 hypothetical protein [Kosakonia sacchari]